MKSQTEPIIWKEHMGCEPCSTTCALFCFIWVPIFKSFSSIQNGSKRGAFDNFFFRTYIIGYKITYASDLIRRICFGFCLCLYTSVSVHHIILGIPFIESLMKIALFDIISTLKNLKYIPKLNYLPHPVWHHQ